MIAHSTRPCLRRLCYEKRIPAALAVALRPDPPPPLFFFLPNFAISLDGRLLWKKMEGSWLRDNQTAHFRSVEENFAQHFSQRFVPSPRARALKAPPPLLLSYLQQTPVHPFLRLPFLTCKKCAESSGDPSLPSYNACLI